MTGKRWARFLAVALIAYAASAGAAGTARTESPADWLSRAWATFASWLTPLAPASAGSVPAGDPDGEPGPESVGVPDGASGTDEGPRLDPDG